MTTPKRWCPPRIPRPPGRKEPKWIMVYLDVELTTYGTEAGLKRKSTDPATAERAVGPRPEYERDDNEGVGGLAELAVKLPMGLPMVVSLNTFQSELDVPHCCDVKATRQERPEFTRMPLRDWEHPAEPDLWYYFVTHQGTNTDGETLLMIRGRIQRKDAAVQDFWAEPPTKDDGSPAWWVPIWRLEPLDPGLYEWAKKHPSGR